MSDDKTPMRRLRSQDWFDNPDHLDMTALYLERFMNYGVTPENCVPASRLSASPRAAVT